MIIYLIGFMAAGKSTLGKLLAEKSQWKLIDLDEWIEENEKLKIPDIFNSKGEKYFRTVEAEALRIVSLEPSDCIISCGGGTPGFHDNMNFMNENGTTVYLEVPIEELVRRLMESDGERPLLKDSSEEVLMELFKKRESIYRQAKITLPENGRVEEWVEVLVGSGLL